MGRYYLKDFSLPDTWNLDETFTLRDLIENSSGEIGEIGKYLYSDGSFRTYYSSSAIGVVYWKNDSKCKVVALQNVDSNTMIWGLRTRVNETYDTLDGSNSYGYLPIYGSYQSSPHLSFTEIGGNYAFGHNSGHLATKNIAAKGSEYPAAYKCNQYGNSAWNVGKPGDWYLPTIGELALIYKAHGLYNSGDTDFLTKTGFSSMKGQYFWSCTEYSPSDTYRISFPTGYVYHYTKNYYNSIRAVLEINL